VSGHEFFYAGEEMLRQFVGSLTDVEPDTRNEIYTLLFRDAEAVAQYTGGLEESHRSVRGLFVDKIHVFSDPITHVPLFIRKPIAMASQLSRASRGFHGGGVYGFTGPRLLYGRVNVREHRPLLNLAMLRFLMRALREEPNLDHLWHFFAEPRIILSSNGKAFQVMEHLDTEIKIFDQTLPRNGRTLTQLVVNLCEAACVANVTFQCDCCTNNLCLVKDEVGDICGIRSFDCDIMNSGDKGDLSELLDFTNLQKFDVRNSSFQVNTTLGCFDMRAALPPLISRPLYDALNRSMDRLRAIALAFSSDRSQGIPYLLQHGGLLEQWLTRVMILGEDGRLYQNAESENSVNFDESAALFVLYRVGCSNRSQSLFASLSFVDLRERYSQKCSPEREAELTAFFRHFGIENWAAACPSME
jgi:hypothetical protein